MKHAEIKTREARIARKFRLFEDSSLYRGKKYMFMIVFARVFVVPLCGLSIVYPAREATLRSKASIVNIARVSELFDLGMTTVGKFSGVINTKRCR